MARAAAIRAQIEEITADEKLQNDLKILPSNYNFEVPKTIWKIRTTNSKYVTRRSSNKYTECDTLIMGDVTYGACCVDDYTARGLGCDLLVHYGHSCLVPIQDTQGIHMLYIFVNIDMNLSHFIDILKANFSAEGSKIALVSTVQFVVSLQVVKTTLESDGYSIVIPQCKPLSPGEVLGCTSPRIAEDVTALIYLGDGRFHLESAMIHNPKLPAYQYDPYSRKLTKESYDFDKMTSIRGRAVEVARGATTFGLIQGTLGRQGNIRIVEELEAKLAATGKKFVRVLMSEIFPDKLKMFSDVDCWVQVACPRLSIDWGVAFEKPLLTPYELSAALDHVPFRSDYYPMDFYSNDSLGPWTNNHEKHRPRRTAARRHIVVAAEN
ncbi:hypothetical protein QR680_012701 [Steinernema hermaphroditum]|uniref:2-(3-amino-3-carboxypropyl)histidine synthase subunit 1 n=1 Tax=Steinernema hermaphroditum TaxID=289476 RepID=A0AA39I4W8_9BILA|nr:hypothetical protein QR680_012701 [Steinernema hermaphroditum]